MAALRGAPAPSQTASPGRRGPPPARSGVASRTRSSRASGGPLTFMKPTAWPVERPPRANRPRPRRRPGGAGSGRPAGPPAARPPDGRRCAGCPRYSGPGFPRPTITWARATSAAIGRRPGRRIGPALLLALALGVLALGLLLLLGLALGDHLGLGGRRRGGRPRPPRPSAGPRSRPAAWRASSRARPRGAYVGHRRHVVDPEGARRRCRAARG